MPYLNLRDTPIRLPAGQLRIGRGRDVEITLPGAPDHVSSDRHGSEGGAAPLGGVNGNKEGQFALLVVDPSGSATLTKLSEDAPVYLNSVPAGLEPTPLLHGDRVEIDGVELRFSDDRQTGATGEFPILSHELTEAAPKPTPAPAGYSAADRGGIRQSARVAAPVKNGRLVSLLDGREYAVTDAGLSIGRDAACDVVVPANSVSRRHARIALEVRGYTVTDNSTNGVIVSGERVRSTRLLKRGDTVRVGPEEFRFYEEEAEDDPTPAMAKSPLRLETPLPPPAKAKAPVLATLVIANQGLDRGKAFEVVSTLTHIGRGAHNDILLNDDSVSESHAKLQRRDNRWILVDLDSTNGTYVAGERLTGEVELHRDTELRFGGAKLVFKPTRGMRTPSVGTRVVAAFKKTTPSGVPVIAAQEASVEKDEDGPNESKRSLAILWVALLGVLALTLSIILRALW